MSSLLFLVIDASVLIGLCAKDPDKYAQVVAALQDYINRGYARYSPHLAVMEVLYILCNKLQAGDLTPAEHATAVANLQSVLTTIETPPNGDAALITRTEEIRQGYGCSRSADSLYIALAESLSAVGPTELLTFDAGQKSQANLMAPSITVNLLVPVPVTP